MSHQPTDEEHAAFKRSEYERIRPSFLSRIDLGRLRAAVIYANSRLAGRPQDDEWLRDIADEYERPA